MHAQCENTYLLMKVYKMWKGTVKVLDIKELFGTIVDIVSKEFRLLKISALSFFQAYSIIIILGLESR